MRQHTQNGWFHASEFMRAAEVIHKTATEEHTRWLGFFGCKYLQLRVDQRTGDFIFQNEDGKHMESDAIYLMFPELKD